MTLKSIKPEEWPERFYAGKAVVRFPNGVESGSWYSKPVERGEATREYVRADLSALPARGVGVKPLVWEETEGKSYRQANCPIGQYQISWLVEFECWQLAMPPKAGQAWRGNFSRYPHKDAAKAAAQADYEARILAALAPMDAAQAREAALREAASVILNDFDALLKVAGKATEAHNSGLSLTEGVRQGLRSLIGEART